MGAEVAGGQLEKGAAREREDGGNVWVSRAERYSMDEAADTGSLQAECELTIELAQPRCGLCTEAGVAPHCHRRLSWLP